MGKKTTTLDGKTFLGYQQPDDSMHCGMYAAVNAVHALCYD